MNSGDLLRNRYRIEKALATGGFGETYLAIDLDYPGQPQVVVKHLKPAQSDTESLKNARRLFESEAHILAELGKNSDRIPALYAYFEDGTLGYMPTEQAIGRPRLASDVYAVGAIGIQCLTGKHPNGLFDEDVWRCAGSIYVR
jgi:serine/threonine protein kinase